MANISVKKIREIVHYREMNISERETAALTFTSKGSVGRIWKRAKDNGWLTETLRFLTDDEVNQLFYPKIEKRDMSKAVPDFQKIHSNLTKFQNRSLFHEWYNFRKENPDTYS